MLKKQNSGQISTQILFMHLHSHLPFHTAQESWALKEQSECWLIYALPPSYGPGFPQGHLIQPDQTFVCMDWFPHTIVWPKGRNLSSCSSPLCWVRSRLCLNPSGVTGRRRGNKTMDHVLTRWNRGEGVTQNHGWLLNDIGLNCAGPLIYGFFSIVATAPHHLWLVKFADAKPQIRRNYIYREGQLHVLCAVLTAWRVRTLNMPPLHTHPPCPCCSRVDCTKEELGITEKFRNLNLSGLQRVSLFLLHRYGNLCSENLSDQFRGTQLGSAPDSLPTSTSCLSFTTKAPQTEIIAWPWLFREVVRI